MAKKVVKLNEKELRNVISKTLNEVFVSDTSRYPSLEKEFEEKLCDLVERYRMEFFESGWNMDDLYDYCCDILKKVIF